MNLNDLSLSIESVQYMQTMCLSNGMRFEGHFATISLRGRITVTKSAPFKQTNGKSGGGKSVSVKRDTLLRANKCLNCYILSRATRMADLVDGERANKG